MRVKSTAASIFCSRWSGGDQHVHTQHLDCLPLFGFSLQHLHHLFPLYQKRPLCATFFDRLSGDSVETESSVFIASLNHTSIAATSLFMHLPDTSILTFLHMSFLVLSRRSVRAAEHQVHMRFAIMYPDELSFFRSQEEQDDFLKFLLMPTAFTVTSLCQP